MGRRRFAVQHACRRGEKSTQTRGGDAAAALAGEATIPRSGAWTFCFLVTACTAVLDYERASEWCDRINEFAERYGSRYMLAFCRAGYGAGDGGPGGWTQAPKTRRKRFGSARASRRSAPRWAN